MYAVLILFGEPTDRARFARHVEDTHRPLLDGLPGAEAVDLKWVAGRLAGEMAVHLVIEVSYASEAALQESLNSPAGQDMARDYANFASGGVTILASVG
jgi:uncharacterized protein (TIGR02118 family)